MITVELVRCLIDNYAYVLSSSDQPGCVIVDACETWTLRRAVRDKPVVAILSTHHHADHVGANEDLLELYPKLEVYGHTDEWGKGRIPGLRRWLRDGQEFAVLGETVVALHVPGHTRTSVAYYLPKQGLLFTGDTLFAGGCGRMFEGTADEFYASLLRLAALPESTLIYGGHDYVIQNLEFALQVDSENADLKARLAACREEREVEELSQPSTLAEELKTNPFLRVTQPFLRATLSHWPAERAEDVPPAELFARLRKRKDKY